MDAPSMVAIIWSHMWWVLPLALLASLLKSSGVKGWLGEAQIKCISSWHLPADSYHSLHDITLTTLDGSTQVDHVFVSRFGIFVVETKNMKGWIFGTEHQAQWTQRLYKKSFRFQNPLRQNYKHIKAIEAVTGLPLEVIHSLVVFVGDSRFKTPMPTNVTQGGGYVRYIKSFTEEMLTDTQVEAAVVAIQSGRLQPTRATRRMHVAQLQQRSNPNVERYCPACGNKMLLRTATKGGNAGNRFWGCSTYPKCRVIQKCQPD